MYMFHIYDSPEREVVPNFCQPLNQLVHHDFFKPIHDIFRQMNQLTVNESSSDEKFQVYVDVQHFAPEEINVKVVVGFIIVEGKHEEKQDVHGFISRQFTRRYALPQACLPDTVESKLSSDGILTVSAPKVLALPSVGERIVPITQTGPVKVTNYHE